MVSNHLIVEMSAAALTKAGYHVLRSLGTDELGDVYLAEQTDHRQLVVLRVFRPEFSADEEIARELRWRSSLLAQPAMDHPNLTGVYGCGETEDGRLFIATEHIDGESLAEVIRRAGPLELERCLRLAVQIAQGLEFLHNGVGSIHGDLRPENVVVAADGATVKLSGFAITGTKRAGRAIFSRPTVPTAFEYLAPEQIRGEAISEPTDIYAFGLLVYEMLSGTPPFAASTPDVIVARQLNEAPAPLKARRPDIPGSINRLVLHALEKRPDQRPLDMTEIANALWAELSRLQGRIPRPKRQRLLRKTVAVSSLAMLVAASAWIVIRQVERLPSTITNQSSPVMSTAAVVTPIGQVRPELDPPEGGTTEAASQPAKSLSVGPREPMAQPDVLVPARSAAPPTAEVEHDGERFPQSHPSAQTSVEQRRLAAEDVTKREGGTRRKSVRAPAKSVRAPAMALDEEPSYRAQNRPAGKASTGSPAIPRTPDAPDPSEIIDWLLGKSSTAR
jgi:serine/threonine protein kinase